MELEHEGAEQHLRADDEGEQAEDLGGDPFPRAQGTDGLPVDAVHADGGGKQEGRESDEVADELGVDREARRF